MIRSVIAGTGTYIPEKIIRNGDFIHHAFYKGKDHPIEQAAAITIQNFENITGIKERLYAGDAIVTSDMATVAARMAVEEAGISLEAIDCIILAHNYGDRKAGNTCGDYVPSLASRVKHNLGIRNPDCIPYDLIFGCPGWVQGMIQADCYIKSGMAKYCLVIGADTLSRIIDPADRDSMIFSDGAGACVLKAEDTDRDAGTIASSTRSDTLDESLYIATGASYADAHSCPRYIKMMGHKVYIYALTHVPLAMKACLDKSGFDIGDLKMIFLHQANEKMDAAIVKKFYELYGIATPPEKVMPMNISWMGNSSVATVPTLYHQVVQHKLENFEIKKGDLVMFASVGAGMNINALTYIV